MTFGQKLKDLRSRTGKSQAGVAAEISEMYPDFSISQTYLSALEKRENAPKEEILEVLAEYYSVDIMYFFDDITAEDERRGINLAKGWLNAIRRSSFKTGKAFARTDGFQNINDDVQESMENLNDNYGDDDEYDEFLDF